MKLSDEGKEQIIRFLFEGDFFGQYALLENQTTLCPSHCSRGQYSLSYSQGQFWGILERNPNIAMKYMLVLSERLQLADEWIGAMSLLENQRSA